MLPTAEIFDFLTTDHGMHTEHERWVLCLHISWLIFQWVYLKVSYCWLAVRVFCSIKQYMWYIYCVRVLQHLCLCVCKCEFCDSILPLIRVMLSLCNIREILRLSECASNLPWPRVFFSAENSGFGLKATLAVTHSRTCRRRTPSLTLHFKLIIFHPSDKSNKSLQEGKSGRGKGRQRGGW